MHISKLDKGYVLNTCHALKLSTSFRATFIEELFGDKNQIILDDSYAKLREVAANMIRKVEKEEYVKKLTTFCAWYCFATTLPIILIGLSKQYGIFVNTYSTLLLFSIIILLAAISFFYASKAIFKTNCRSYTICFMVISCILIGILLCFIFGMKTLAAIALIFILSLVQLICDLCTFMSKNEAFCKAMSIKKCLEDLRGSKKDSKLGDNFTPYALNINNSNNIDKRLIPYACVLDMDDNIKQFAQECIRILDM